jgi:hypothetical protein
LIKKYLLINFKKIIKKMTDNESKVDDKSNTSSAALAAEGGEIQG